MFEAQGNLIITTREFISLVFGWIKQVNRFLIRSLRWMTRGGDGRKVIGVEF